MITRLWKAETLFPLVMAAVIAVLLADTLQAPPRPRLLPMIVQVILLALLLFQTYVSIFKAEPKEAKKNDGPSLIQQETKRLFLTFVEMAVFVIAVYLAGYLLASMLLAFGLCYLWGVRSIRNFILVEILVVVLLYGVFQKIFDILLPTGLLFGGIGF